MENTLDPKKALILERSLRLFKYLFLNEPQPPFKLILTPTDRCNLNCIFCPNFIARKQQRFKIEDEMSDDEWLDVINQGVRLGVRQWCFLGGGEPLLRGEIIPPALDRIRKKLGIVDLEIITNGTLFTEEIIRRIVEACEERVAIQITVSVHGKNKTYQEITGIDSYEQVVKNIEIISKLKKGNKARYPILQINIVVNKKNLNEIEDLILTFGDIGVNQVALHPVHVYDETSNVVKNIVPSSEEYKMVLKIAERLRLNFQNMNIDTLSLTSYLQQSDLTFKDKKDESVRKSIEIDPKYRKYEFLTLRCFEPWYDILINPDGRVGRCAAFFTRNEPINVKKESLEDIWFGEFLNEVRSNVKNGILMEGCSPCALMSNTIVLREELKKLIDLGLGDDTKTVNEVENLINKFYLDLRE
jgi:MoaA/NifB/PqqE/SkfB family radical SAM enzyme